MSSSKTDHFLIVVCILQGRHFPKSPSLQLVVQASFNGEPLDTDPVDHRDQPLFNNELAWELDRRTLHQHRLQRTPIKLHCFAVDSISKKRESVGYIVLDLRSVQEVKQEVKQEPRWYPLLSSKYNKHKPSLLLSLGLENDPKPREASPEPIRAKEALPPQGSSSLTDLDVLIPEKRFYPVEQSETNEDDRGPLPPPDQRACRSPPALNRPSTPPPPPPVDPPSSHTESEAEILVEELHRDQKRTTDTDVGLPAQLHIHPDAAAEGGVSAPTAAVSSTSHHFCFSLDLCSLRNLSFPHPISASLRYTYPFFGNAAPIMTSPPVELQPNMEVSFPRSYCAFDFATLPHQLQDIFNRVPLVVEVWHRDSTSRDQLIGRASIQLCVLLSSERSGFLGSTGEQGWRQSVQEQIPVVGAQCPNETVAELRYTATLEDLGLVNVEMTTNPPVHTQPPVPQSVSVEPPIVPPMVPMVPQCSRDTLEYQTAMELELWKKEQEDLFEDQLRKKERRHMEALAEEWRRRDQEREAVVNKKEVEYNRLEEQLQNTLADLERREKHLVEAELETKRLQRELRAEHGLAQRDLQESSRRKQQECDHRVALEKDKIHMMEEERARLLQQITDGVSRYKQLEKEFLLYREQQNIRPEFTLQTEVNLLTLEKVELERKLESTMKSKLHYKQQWGRALNELARFKEREQKKTVILFEKQQSELEAMRLRCAANEEVLKDRKELDNLRNHLNRLKEQNRSDPAHSDPAPNPAGLSQNVSADSAYVSRLLEERDILLRTGVYTHQDRIIADLNRQIQDNITHSGEL